MKKETDIVLLGRDPKKHYGVVNPPVYHASTIVFPTLADYNSASRGIYPQPVYGRYGTPGTKGFEEALAKLEGADHAIVTSSGVAAIAVAIMSFVKAGDNILVPDSVYDPARRYLAQELARFNVTTTYYDPLIGAGIDALIQENTSIVYVESPGSLTFEVQDIPAIAKAAHAKGCVVIADNTWATPLYSRPFDWGVDVSLYSASKYIAGHSDLIMGVVTCKAEYYEQLNRTYRNLGCCPGPDDVYLAQRGLRTLAVRLKQHQEAGIAIANWLKKRPEVVAVRHPALPDCPGHAIWKRDFTGASGLFTFLIKPYAENQLAAMMDHMELFKMGYSWGGYESLMIPIRPTAIRTATQWAHDGIALRIHVGLENPDDLIADLEAGFKRLNG